MTITYIRYGSVGLPLASNLQEFGHEVKLTARNSTSDSVQKALKVNNELLISSPSSAVLNADIIFLADIRKEIEQETEYLLQNSVPALTERIKVLIETVLKLEKVVLHPVHDNAVGFYVGNRQLAHIHPCGHLDIHFPVEIGDVLVERTFLTTHRLHEKNGWYSLELHNEQDIGEAQCLLQLAYALYEIKKRGGDDDITQQELADLNLDDCAYEHIVTAAARWKCNAA